MSLCLWKDGQVVAKIIGGISPCPTIEYPEQHRCELGIFIDVDDHFEIYPSDGSGMHMHVESISCRPENGNIIFTFIATGYR